jgi:hypothetical protein
MTTDSKMKVVKKKKGSDEDIITKMTKHVQKKFPKREIEVKITSDDGGRVLEVHVNEAKLSRAVRDFLPLNWEGWRTVVINRYATSGAE